MSKNFITERVRDLRASDHRDDIRTTLLTVVSGIPVIGGPLSSLLSEYLPNWKLERCVTFLEELTTEFERVRERLDATIAQSAQYGLLFEHVLKQVSQTSGERKRAAYRAILLNSCTPAAPGAICTDHSSLQRHLTARGLWRV